MDAASRGAAAAGASAAAGGKPLHFGAIGQGNQRFDHYSCSIKVWNINHFWCSLLASFSHALPGGWSRARGGPGGRRLYPSQALCGWDALAPGRQVSRYRGMWCWVDGMIGRSDGWIVWLILWWWWWWWWWWWGWGWGWGAGTGGASSYQSPSNWSWRGRL